MKLVSWTIHVVICNKICENQIFIGYENSMENIVMEFSCFLKMRFQRIFMCISLTQERPCFYIIQNVFMAIKFSSNGSDYSTSQTTKFKYGQIYHMQYI